MATLNLLDPNDSQQRDAWDAYVGEAKNGTVFHTTAWMDVIHRGLGLEPRYLYLKGAGDLIEGLVPLFRAGSIFSKPRWLNLPQSIPSHVLAQGPKDSDILLGLIAQSAREENTQVVCLRTTKNYSPSLPPAWETRRENPVHHHSMSLAGCHIAPGHLPEAQPRFRTSVRKYRRKFFASGGKIVKIELDNVAEFAVLVNRGFYWRKGFLSFPIDFYRQLLISFQDQVRITMIKDSSGNALAYIVCIWSPPEAYAFLYGNFPGGDESGASIIGLSEAIFEAAQAGIKVMDFGESGPLQKGISTHKERWGAKLIDGSYFVMSPKGMSSGLRKMGESNAWSYPMVKRLPSWLALKLAKTGHKLFQ